MNNVVITKGSKYYPEPNECLTCPYQDQCNSGEKCIEDADKVEARLKKQRLNSQKYKQKK